MNEIQRNLVKQINYERREDHRTSVEIQILDEHPEVKSIDGLNFYLEKAGLNPYVFSENDEEEIWDAILRNIEHFKEYGESIRISVFSKL